MTEKQQMFIMKLMIVVFIVISVILAIVQYNKGVTFIAQLMGVSWGALAGAFLAPFLYGLYWKRATKAACWVSFAFSTVVMILNIFVRSSFPKMLQSPINAGAFCMIAGLILVPIVSAFTKAPDKAHIDDVFACYERKVTVRAKEAIGDEEVQF
jgi:SSS family solute:Na+ symporter